MKDEIAIYMFIGLLLFSIRRIYSGIENGAFYAKGNEGFNPFYHKLQKFIRNYHYVETPAWYARAGGTFFLCLAVIRSVNYSTDLREVMTAVVASVLCTMGSSALAGYWYQGWINWGSGKDFIDPYENKKSEFAFWKWKFWWPRPWYGKRRILASMLGLVSILLGIYLGLFY